MQEYKLTGQSKYPSPYTATVDDICLSESEIRRTILRAEFVNNPKDSGPIRIALLHQKKSAKDEWIDDREYDMKNVKNGELVKWNLSTAQTKELFEHLSRLYAAAESNGVPKGENTLVVGEKSKIITINEENKRQAIEQLISRGDTNELWQQIVESDGELANKLSLGHIQSLRNKALEEFRESVTNNTLKENYWQNFFERNKWIFGYGLNYRILRHQQSQPNYGGMQVEGIGAQRGDFLFSTEGDTSFTVLVEIKTPFTSLTTGPTSVRNGAWRLAQEVTDGIVQLQANQKTWEQSGAKDPSNIDRFEKNDVYTVSPKGILVIGRLESINGDRDKRETFERFRQSISGIEILTFDEVLERAQHILIDSDDGALPPVKSDDLPPIEECPF